jgi:DNA replication protein DnaC
MTTDIVIEQLRALRLTQMSQALEHQRQQANTFTELSFEERLTLLLGHELLGRENNRLNRLRKQARLRLAATPEQLHYAPERGLRKAAIAELLSGNYLKQRQNILLTGPTGCGKTYLACALGEQACRQHYPVKCYRLGRLLDELISARADGSYNQLMSRLAKAALLILDDWGLEKLTARQAGELLEVMEDRYQLSSTIIASQVPIENWHQMLTNPTVADALLDRLVHNSQRIALTGESQRKMLLTQSDHSE